MASQSTQAVLDPRVPLLKLEAVKDETKKNELPAVSSPVPVRSPRSMQPGVFARLQALFPPSLSSSQSTSNPPSLPKVATPSSIPCPEFIKTRIITWNMHDSLPKGDLEELFGSVPLHTPRTPADDTDRMALPGLSLEETHPYHIIVVGGQECPTLSGIPLGLAANFKHWDAKDREKEKEKHKEHDPEKDREKDRSKENHLLLHTKSLLSKHLKHEHMSHVKMHDFDPAADIPPVHSPAPTSGWSAVLEDWFANGVGSLHDVKPVVTATTLKLPGGDPHSNGDIVNTNTSGLPKSSTSSSDRQLPNTVDVNWKSNSPGVDTESFSASDAQGKTGPYELLVKERLMGIYTAVYVHRDVRSLVRGVSTGTVPAGLIGGRLGNKGGVGVSVDFRGTTLLFINAHLAAHEGKVPLRVANLAKIKAELPVESFLHSDDPRTFSEDITDRFDHTLIFGDLNFRLDISRLHADWLVSRKEYTQALAFDQLSKLMKDGDPTFAGLHEADIDFPPTFKYDVLRTVKREKHKSRHDHRPSKGDLDDVEEKEALYKAGHVDPEEDEDDELGEATSLRSSTWTSNNSKNRINGTENGDDSDPSPTSSPAVGGDIALSPTSKLVFHAALKAKTAWMALLNASRDSRTANISPKHRRRISAARLGVPGSSIELSRGTKATSNVSAASLAPPILRRAASTKTSLAQRKQEDEFSSSDTDKGVYDSSSKQRVPSWCDRILWKTTVEQPEEPVPEPEPDQEADPARSRVRTNRVSQRFLQAFRPRVRRDSTRTGAPPDTPRLSDQRDVASTSPVSPRLAHSSGEAPPITSPGLFQSKSLDPLPTIPPNQIVSSLAADARGRRRSVSATVVSGVRESRRLSMPVYSRPPGSLPPPRRAETDQVSSHPDNMAPTSSPTIPTGRPAPRRWFLNLLSRDHAPLSPPASPVPGPQLPPTRAPQHRKGDVVCLCYRTLDDRQMRRLEGRSDHRPVIGSYAIYV